MDFLSLVISAGTAIGTTYITKGEFGPIEIMSDLLYSKFGDFHENIEDKKQLRVNQRKSLEIKETVDLTAKKVAAIPESEIHDPRENIVRPTLSILEDYCSEEHTRNMFAKLLAASMDSSKDEVAQQAFVEIVKNLSPIDAQNLVIINNNETIPIAFVSYYLNNGATRSIFTNLMISNPDCKNYKTLASSLNNLNRLGLIALNYNTAVVDINIYAEFEKTIIYQDALQELKTKKKEQTKLLKRGLPLPPYGYKKLQLTKGVAQISPLGQDFCSICLSP